MKENWKTGWYAPGVEAAMPGGAGVYVIARVTRVAGFPVAIEPLYVGRSVDLRRRMVQHQHWREPNPGLNRLHRERHTEIWWQSIPREALDEVEAELIRQLSPGANRRGRRGVDHLPRHDCCMSSRLEPKRAE